jgi:NDP-hexose-3-ketoreductase
MPAVADSSSAGRPLNIGVLGCSEIAVRRFVPALLKSVHARLAAVASRDHAVAANYASNTGAMAMGYEEMLSSPSVDLIYIPLPNHLHEAWVIAALNHGKHVLCEKPLGLSPDSVDRMLEAANCNGVLLYENIMYLQHPQHRHIKELLAAGRVGTVTGLNCVFTIPGPPSGNFRLDPHQGGGAFHDLNRYPLSAAGYFLRGAIGDIIRCDACWQDGLVISLEAEARTTEDERFTFSIAFRQPYCSFYEISGTQGTLRLDRAFTPPADHHCLLEICGNDSSQTIRLSAHDHFQLTIDHVAALIASADDYAAEHEAARSLAYAAERFLLYAHAQRGLS